jgi:hypothetical protein
MRNLNSMSGHGWAHVMLWVGMGGHRSLLMVMVWVWVQIRRKMLGFGEYIHAFASVCRLCLISPYKELGATFQANAPSREALQWLPY